MPFFYNTDLVPDNEFGALDNATLLAEIKKRAEEEAAAKAKADAEKNYYKRDPKTGLSPAQVEAAQAKADAAQASKDAQAEKDAADQALAKAKAEAEAKAKAETDAEEIKKQTKVFKTETVEIASAQCPSGRGLAKVGYNYYGKKIEETFLNCIGGGGGSSTVENTTPVKTPDPTPPVPLKTSLIETPIIQKIVKTAPIDTILFDFEDQPIEIMSDLLLENIGGHELINIARNDTINGQTVTYQPIKNLTSIQQQYNPNNVVALQNTSDKYFANFSIKLETKLPEEGNGPDAAYVYIEDATGDLIIELINLEPDEQIEVQISLSGTIYEAEFNESW